MTHGNVAEAVSGDDEPFTDKQLEVLDRNKALNLMPATRRRWFYLKHVLHRELQRVSEDVVELLEPNNDVKIVSVIGMTGIGKTSLVTRLLQSIYLTLDQDSRPSDCPVIYVSAPANGERAMSWKVLYRRILEAGGEFELDRKRAVVVENGRMTSTKSGHLSLGQLREHVERMLRHRRVRFLVIDEALHLMRYSNETAIMDTLKSLADAHDTKLVLIGTHQIAPLMTQYGQLVRRSEIVHFRRYILPDRPQKKPTPDEVEFECQLVKFQKNWPCEEVPNLVAIQRELMNASLGSIGLLKSSLLRMASLQLSAQGERLSQQFIAKALKGVKNRQAIWEEATKGEAELEGLCYGDGTAATDSDLTEILNRLKGAARA